jgi:hypothetical protein
MSNFSPLTIVICRFFTWIAPSDVGLRVSLILVRKANAVKGGTTSVVSLLSPISNPHTWWMAQH